MSTNFNQSMLAALGAAILTITSVGAAVGPAHAIETSPVALVAAPVSGQVDA
jgi:hypothetical protein